MSPLLLNRAVSTKIGLADTRHLTPNQGRFGFEED